MDRNRIRLYEVLSVSKTATQAEIKRASLALQHHPDRHSGGNGTGSTASRVRFQEIAEAYEILGDPRKRRIYDHHGMTGVRLEGSSFAPWLMFGFEQIICFVSTILSFILALLFFFIVALSLRVDGKIDWNYAVVFIPIWIMSVFGYLGLFGELVLLSPFKDDAGSEEQDGSATDERPTPAWKRTKIRRVLKYFLKLVVLMLETTLQILIVLKANDPSTLPATVVLAPYLAMRLIESITKIDMLVELFKITEGANISIVTKLILAIDVFWTDIILWSLTILVMLRIDHYITWSWFFVLSPLGLIAVKSAIVLLWHRIEISRMQASEERQQAEAQFLADVAAFVVLMAIGYSFAALVAAKLDGHAIPALVIAAPFLVALAIGFCCTACCLPCAAYVARSTGDGLGSGPIRV
ncbi:hypothetical protein BGZ72_011067 [Mortierella alpina]|nr:hypothetical protein BGZ72_011067 [Mortierella alpina]